MYSKIEWKTWQKETYREPQYENGNYIKKKSQIEVIEWKITVFKLKTLLDVLKSIRQSKGKDQWN